MPQSIILAHLSHRLKVSYCDLPSSGVCQSVLKTFALNDIQYTKRGFTIFHVGFGVATLCLAQSRWFHGDGHREFQVNQRDSQCDEECGVIIDFREMGCFIATPCLFVSGREIPCLYVSEREIYDLLFTFAISAHGSKVQFTAYAQKPS